MYVQVACMMNNILLFERKAKKQNEEMHIQLLQCLKNVYIIILLYKSGFVNPITNYTQEL